MTALDDLRSGLGTLARHPDTIGPHYLLAVGVTFAARTPLVLGAGAAVALLQSQGRIAPVIRELGAVDWQSTDPAAAAGLQDAVLGLVTPGAVLIGLLSVVAATLVFVVARGVADAATLDALAAGVDGRDPLVAGTRGIGTDWAAFTAVALVRGAVLVGGGVLLLVGVGLAATGVGLLLGGPLLLVTLPLVLLALLLLAFAGPAIAVDGRGALSGLGAGVRFPLRRPLAFLGYAAIVAVAVVGVVVCAVVCNLLGVPQVTALVVLLGVTPTLDAIKVGLYAGSEAAETHAEPTPGQRADEWVFPFDERDEGSPEPSPATPGDAESSTSFRRRLVAGQRRGLRELASFLRVHPLANLAGVATLLLGAVLGWLLTAPYGTELPLPSDVSGVFGPFAVAPFVNIAANNWLVAVAHGLGGVGLGVPTATNLLFNGALIGGLAGVFDPTAFVAFVVPHGLVEVPALGVSGGLGYHLGAVVYRALRGRADAETVAAELQRAAWVVVGLVPPFVLAAFVEAFLTPRIAALVLGG
ncbi:MAG: stage II sporulation protein M [Haloferacaceae archaeon]